MKVIFGTSLVVELYLVALVLVVVVGTAFRKKNDVNRFPFDSLDYRSDLSIKRCLLPFGTGYGTVL